MHDSPDRFLRAFPRDDRNWQPIDAAYLEAQVQDAFAVTVPSALVEFWERVGAGYFADRELYVFGDGKVPMDRDCLVEWNRKDFWLEIYPRPSQGGPVFFAETCFGDQIGFRWEGEQCPAVLFVPETFEAFVLADSPRSLFASVLDERYACTDPDRLRRVAARLGPLPEGMHYVPNVSPLVGGSDDADNFTVETPNVHMRTALALYKSLHG